MVLRSLFIRAKQDVFKILSVCLLVLLCNNLLAHQDKYPTGFKLPDDAKERIHSESNRLKVQFSKKPGAVSFVDNSILKFFPPIFNQKGSSCGQASGIGYLYTYELNILLNRAANSTKNVASYMYTWNYINEAKGYGSWPGQGWDIINENGAITEYDFHTSSFTEWANGYDKYYRGMFYGIKKQSYINVGSDPDAAINALKQYLIDHGNGSEYGGCVIFTAMADPLPGYKNYDGPSYTGYKCVLSRFPVTGAHAMTIAGFDDKVECDVNGNGVIESNEIGAFLCVNSWGSSWGDRGRFYMPYQLVRLGNQRGGCDPTFYTAIPELRDPKLTFKVQMEHSSRNDLSFELGVSNDVGAKSPSRVIHRKKIMYRQAGDLQMRGLNGSAFKKFEFGLDATDLLKYVSKGSSPTFFLKINNKKNGKSGTGKLISFSVLDYTAEKANPQEYKCSEEDIKLESTNLFAASVLKYEYENEDNISFLITNPENKEGKIYLKLKTDERLKIEVVNPSSNTKTLLFDETFTQGSCTKTWSSEGLAPGVYAIRIIAYNQVLYKTIEIQ